MKALWVINSPIGTAAEKLGYSATDSGKWIKSTEQKIKAAIPELEIVYVVMGNISRTVCDEKDKITVIELGKEIKKTRGKKTASVEIQVWKKLISEVKPELIHIWGTEYSNFLDVINAFDDIPCIVTVQGVMSAISKYVSGNISFGEIIKEGPLALPSAIKYYLEIRNKRKQADIEKEIIAKSDCLLVDNDWVRYFCNSVSNGLNYCYFPLPVSGEYASVKWDINNIRKNTLFSVAASSDMKGLHMLLKAVSMVKKDIPDIILKIPGGDFITHYSSVKKPVYRRYIESFIKRYQLAENVQFVGKLTSGEMAEEFSKCNVFVMPSKIENQSSTLREAMYVGCPCISAFVGATGELYNGSSLLMYRYEEYEVLAGMIKDLLLNEKKALEVAKCGKEYIASKYPIDDSLEECVSLYKKYMK